MGDFWGSALPSSSSVEVVDNSSVDLNLCSGLNKDLSIPAAFCGIENSNHKSHRPQEWKKRSPGSSHQALGWQACATTTTPDDPTSRETNTVPSNVYVSWITHSGPSSVIHVMSIIMSNVPPGLACLSFCNHVDASNCSPIWWGF